MLQMVDGLQMVPCTEHNNHGTLRYNGVDYYFSGWLSGVCGDVMALDTAKTNL